MGSATATATPLPMARACGHDPILIDPRPAFGTAARFPGERLSSDWPDVALAAVGIDAQTAIIILCHDPKIDDPALLADLALSAYYIGCLGALRTHAKRLERRRAGVGEGDLVRLHAPVGLDIGAAHPGEIALSVMAKRCVSVCRTNRALSDPKARRTSRLAAGPRPSARKAC